MKQEYFFLNRYRCFESLSCLVTKPSGSGRAARERRREEGNERPGRYSGTAELNSVTRSATPDEMYRRFFPVNPITSSNDRGCSSGLSYERQDRGGEERRRERRGKEKRERTGYERDERNERRAQRNTATIEDAGVPSRRVKGSGYLETDLPGKGMARTAENEIPFGPCLA